jgi:hypothetical protein
MDQWAVGLRFCDVDADVRQRLREKVYEQRVAA